MKVNAIHGIILLVIIVMIIAGLVFITIESKRQETTNPISIIPLWVAHALGLALAVLLLFANTKYYEKLKEWSKR